MLIRICFWAGQGLDVMGTPSAALGPPRPPLFLFARDSDGGIIVGSQVVSSEKRIGFQGRFYVRTHGGREGCEGGGGTSTRDGVKARLRRWRKEARVGWSLRTSVEAAAASGGLWENPGHSPKGDRILSMTAGWSMKATIRIGPPHRGHRRGSTASTGRMSWATVA